MPEYSTPKVTPTETTKIPGMNGNSSGYIDAKDLLDIIRATFGQANGVATLGSDGKLTSGQLPDLADDVIVVASYATLPNPGIAGKIYITQSNPTNAMYRWDDSLATPDYVELSVDLSNYATKAELAAEESARETEDTNLKNAIDSNTARIENLEQKAGGYSVTQYRGTNAVPTGKAKYAIVESIVGKSRAWNQIIERNTGASFSGTVSDWGNFATIPDIINTSHYYLLCVHVASLSANASLRFRWPIIQELATGWSYILVPTPNNTYYGYQIYSNDGQAVFCSIDVEFARDLTVIFPELTSAQITSLGISGLVQKCPDLLKHDPYGHSIVDTTVEGVESVGVNLWDEDWESGDISNITGEDVPSSTYIRGKGYYPCQPSTEYYAKTSNKVYLVWYDRAKNYLGYTAGGFQNTYKTSPSDAYYFRISINATSYGNNVQICLNSYSDKTTYHPYQKDILSLSSPIILRSAGSVADELDVESGVVTRAMGVVDLGTLTSWNIVTGTLWEATLDAKPVSNSDVMANIICDNYLPSYESYLSQRVGEIAITTTGNVRVNNGSSSVSPTGTLLYELATPTTEQTTPVLDPFLKVEGGGTINTIQTQTPVIDNCLDVGYLAL